MENTLDSNQSILTELRDLKDDVYAMRAQSPGPDCVIDMRHNYTQPKSIATRISTNSPPVAESSDFPHSPPIALPLESGRAYDDNDRASTRSATSMLYIRSVSSLAKDLLNSRPYKRLMSHLTRTHTSSSAESIVSNFYSINSSAREQTWSMLSSMSLGDLSISEIAVFELPITFSDLPDPELFRQALKETAASSRSIKSQALIRSTKLHSAIRSSNTFAIRALLSLTDSLEALDANGHTPLAHAASRGKIGICEILLEKGAQADVTDRNQRTLLSIAASGGVYELCQLG